MGLTLVFDPCLKSGDQSPMFNSHYNGLFA